MSGDARDSVRQSARTVIELDFGILVYPPETDGEPWRAVFTENGQRKYRQGATEAKLAEKLEKVRERLQADAANMERPGADRHSRTRSRDFGCSPAAATPQAAMSSSSGSTSCWSTPTRLTRLLRRTTSVTRQSRWRSKA